MSVPWKMTSRSELVAELSELPPVLHARAAKPAPFVPKLPARPDQTQGAGSRGQTPVVENETPRTDVEPLFDFESPGDLFHFYYPNEQLHGWQYQTCEQLAGYCNGRDRAVFMPPTKDQPLWYNLVAANGSGKDMTIIAPTAIWFAGRKTNSKVVITSSSHDQLKYQTWAHIKALAEVINRELGEEVFEIVEFYIYCRRTGSEIKCFRSDEPGKTEGQHPKLGGEMLVIINEAKSITDALFEAFERYTGYSIWLEISSPGGLAGRFYKTSLEAKVRAPEPVQPGQHYVRYVTAYECPHIRPAIIEKKIARYGINHPLVQSSIFARFTVADDLVFISELYYGNRPAPTRNTFGLPKKAGLDLALGGDDVVLDIWIGNYRHRKYKFNIADASILHHKLIDIFKKEELVADNIVADFGGIGKPIVQRLWEAGWNIKVCRNEQAPLNKKDFANRGAENWHKIKRLVEENLLVLPLIAHGADEDDHELQKQLTTRRYSIEKDKVKLEPKDEMRGRGLHSPDDADAMALAFADTPFETFAAAVERLTAPEKQPARENMDKLVENFRARQHEQLFGPQHTSERARARFSVGNRHMQLILEGTRE